MLTRPVSLVCARPAVGSGEWFWLKERKADGLPELEDFHRAGTAASALLGTAISGLVTEQQLAAAPSLETGAEGRAATVPSRAGSRTTLPLETVGGHAWRPDDSRRMGLEERMAPSALLAPVREAGGGVVAVIALWRKPRTTAADGGLVFSARERSILVATLETISFAL